jgi:hypothetical protein
VEEVLEDAVRDLEPLIDVAAPDSVVDVHVAARAHLDVEQVGEHRAGAELLVDQRRSGAGGLHLVEHRRQLLVLDLDQVTRLVGRVRIGREHHGHRLAGEADLLEGQDGLVVEGGPVVRVGDDPEHVLPRDHPLHAGSGGGGLDVDRADPAVRDGAAEDLRVQHPRELEVVDVVDRSRDLRPALHPAKRLSDRPRHVQAAPRAGACTVFSRARRTCTRTISRL